MQNRKIIVAIDGHSSCGKSTLSKQLAKYLHYNYIDTGAMYRAVTLYALNNGLIESGIVNEEELIKQIDKINITFVFNPKEERSDTYLNGLNVENEIRELKVSNHVSRVASIKEVRSALVVMQKKMGAQKGIVMDGRDIGTVVFPEAELKIFMTANAPIRAQRRFDEMREKRERSSYEEVLRNVKERDEIDSNRAVSPLKKADDALILDNTNLGQEDQLKWAIEKANSIIHEN